MFAPAFPKSFRALCVNCAVAFRASVRRDDLERASVAAGGGSNRKAMAARLGQRFGTDSC